MARMERLHNCMLRYAEHAPDFQHFGRTNPRSFPSECQSAAVDSTRHNLDRDLAERTQSRRADRSFRYAPLSSGLDIVRKSLGRHEIATIQSTDIDKEAVLLRLTTILAHSSGEWISSEWPVCPISDIASSQRMGAAMTYARRYALFALVGIAGEDDLDAPDLDAGASPAGKLARLPDYAARPSGQPAAAQRKPSGDGKLAGSSARSVLGEQLSASLRETLVGQMAALSSEGEAAAWARQHLAAKNTLTSADAKIVEEQFQAKLGTIRDGTADAVPSETSASEQIQRRADHEVLKDHAAQH
jgi:hypothetical protein